MHLERNEFDPFLRRIITGDEKLIVYNNVVQKRSWSKRDEPSQTTSKAELHHEKIMLGWEVMLHPPYSPDLTPRYTEKNSLYTGTRNQLFCLVRTGANFAILVEITKFKFIRKTKKAS